MNDDALLNEIALLLSQLRVARRAIEDIERSTARYNNFAFAAALSAGTGFGAPPLFGGALKVWVVNINDLAPSAGGGFIEQLLGGLGRFFGGFGGGFIGGILGGVSLPVLIGQVHNIAASVERILARIGVNKSSPGAPGTATPPEPEGPGLLQELKEWKGIFTTFTALFQAASGNPVQAESTASSMTDGAQRWLRIVEASSGVIDGIDRVVRGLTILIPVLVGALAELVARLDQMKLAVVELLRFLLQEIFLLRGVLLAAIFDTIAAIARLVSAVLSILSEGLSSIATNIFGLFKDIFSASLNIIQFLADGLQNTVNAVVRWLVNIIGQALSSIASSVIFQELVHVVDVLPLVLPPLVIALQGVGAASAIDDAALSEARKLNEKAMASLPKAAAGNSALDLAAPPSIAATLLPPDTTPKLLDNVDKSLESAKSKITDTLDAASGMLDTVTQQLQDSVKDKGFTDSLRGYTDTLRANSETLAKAISLQTEAGAHLETGGPKTGLEDIAIAYETWLKDGGLKQILVNFTDYFKKPEGIGPLKDKVFGPAVLDRPRATVDIQDVVIQVSEPSEATAPKSAEGHGAQDSDEIFHRFLEFMHDLTERGMKFTPGSPVLQR